MCKCLLVVWSSLLCQYVHSTFFSQSEEYERCFWRDVTVTTAAPSEQSPGNTDFHVHVSKKRFKQHEVQNLQTKSGRGKYFVEFKPRKHKICFRTHISYSVRLLDLVCEKSTSIWTGTESSYVKVMQIL